MRLPGLGLDVFPLCLGTAGWGTDGTLGDARRLFDAYCEAGGNFLDSAHCYAFWKEGHLGASERTLGEVVRRAGVRDRMAIATKGGHPDGGPMYPRRAWFLDPELIHRDIQESLERLQVDAIDLYYLHRDDGRTPVDEIIGALNAEPGLRALGASNWSLVRVGEANQYALSHGLKGFVAVQNQWSLAQPSWQMREDPTVRFVTDRDVAWFEQSGVACIPYSATANGFFATDGAVDLYEGEANRGRLERTKTLAQQKGASPNQIALAWLLAHDFPVVPITGTQNLDHLKDALGSLAVKLTPEERDWLR